MKKNRLNRKKCIEIDRKCMMCGTELDLEPHHIVHQSQGGPDELWNLITLCHGCHLFKVHSGVWEGGKRLLTEMDVIIGLLLGYKHSKLFRWQEALDWWMKRRKREQAKARS